MAQILYSHFLLSKQSNPIQMLLLKGHVAVIEQKMSFGTVYLVTERQKRVRWKANIINSEQ